ncbi:MAG: hypothetical protein JST35_08740 [Armatimonadetes bacterium]|nr:hypothetical protein [Armatimonadota bacterium]
MAEKVWNSGRKWAGNLIPAAVYVPLVVAAVTVMWKQNNTWGLGLVLLLAALAAAWILTNFCGLWQNGFMSRHLRRELTADGVDLTDAVFFGYCSPKFQSLLDAHEDVGYLCFEKDAVIFRGETIEIGFRRGEVKRVMSRPNVHSLLLLGRWIVVETLDGARHKFEPRVANHLLGNLLQAKSLQAKIASCLEGPPSPKAKPTSK